jgi:AcrR family transcriptional regulator
MEGSFQRARSEAQKAKRAARILRAAQALLEENPDSSALSLNELARRAGMAKSNVYRYFESREAILLALLEDAFAAWHDEVLEGLGRVDRAASRDARLERAAATLASAMARRPTLCHLLSVLSTVLEQNLSTETVRAFKRRTAELQGRVAGALHGAVPELSVEAHAELLHFAYALIVGSWPSANPSPTVREVLTTTEGLAGYVRDFEADLRRGFVLLGRGMLTAPG